MRRPVDSDSASNRRRQLGLTTAIGVNYALSWGREYSHPIVHNPAYQQSLLQLFQASAQPLKVAPRQASSFKHPRTETEVSLYRGVVETGERLQPTAYSSGRWVVIAPVVSSTPALSWKPFLTALVLPVASGSRNVPRGVIEPDNDAQVQWVGSELRLLAENERLKQAFIDPASWSKPTPQQEKAHLALNLGRIALEILHQYGLSSEGSDATGGFRTLDGDSAYSSMMGLESATCGGSMRTLGSNAMETQSRGGPLSLTTLFLPEAFSGATVQAKVLEVMKGLVKKRQEAVKRSIGNDPYRAHDPDARVLKEPTAYDYLSVVAEGFRPGKSNHPFSPAVKLEVLVALLREGPQGAEVLRWYHDAVNAIVEGEALTTQKLSKLLATGRCRWRAFEAALAEQYPSGSRYNNGAEVVQFCRQTLQLDVLLAGLEEHSVMLRSTSDKAKAEKPLQRQTATSTSGTPSAPTSDSIGNEKVKGWVRASNAIAGKGPAQAIPAPESWTSRLDKAFSLPGVGALPAQRGYRPYAAQPFLEEAVHINPFDKKLQQHRANLLSSTDVDSIEDALETVFTDTRAQYRTDDKLEVFAKLADWGQGIAERLNIRNPHHPLLRLIAGFINAYHPTLNVPQSGRLATAKQRETLLFVYPLGLSLQEALLQGKTIQNFFDALSKKVESLSLEDRKWAQAILDSSCYSRSLQGTRFSGLTPSASGTDRVLEALGFFEACLRQDNSSIDIKELVLEGTAVADTDEGSSLSKVSTSSSNATAAEEGVPTALAPLPSLHERGLCVYRRLFTSKHHHASVQSVDEQLRAILNSLINIPHEAYAADGTINEEYCDKNNLWRRDRLIWLFLNEHNFLISPTSSKEAVEACPSSREPISHMHSLLKLLLYQTENPHVTSINQRINEFYRTVTLKGDTLSFGNQAINCRSDQRVAFGTMVLQLVDLYELPLYKAQFLLFQALVHQAPQLLAMQRMDEALELDQETYDTLFLLMDLFFHTIPATASENRKWISAVERAASNEAELWRLIHEMSLSLKAKDLNEVQLRRLEHHEISPWETQKLAEAIKTHANKKEYYDLPDVENLVRFIHSTEALSCRASGKESDGQACQKKILTFILAHDRLAGCYQYPTRVRELIENFVQVKKGQINVFGEDISIDSAVKDLKAKFGLTSTAAVGLLDEIYSLYAPQLLLFKARGTDEGYFFVPPQFYAAELARLGVWLQGLDKNTIHTETFTDLREGFRLINQYKGKGGHEGLKGELKHLLKYGAIKVVPSCEETLDSSSYAKHSNQLLGFGETEEDRKALKQLGQAEAFCHHVEKVLGSDPGTLINEISRMNRIAELKHGSSLRQLAVHLIAGANPFPSWLTAEKASEVREAIYKGTKFFPAQQIFFMGKYYPLTRFRILLAGEFPAVLTTTMYEFEHNLLSAVMPQALIEKRAQLKDSVQVSLLGHYLQHQSPETLSVANLQAMADRSDDTLANMVNEGLVKLYQDKKLDTVASLDSKVGLMEREIAASVFVSNQCNLMDFAQRSAHSRALKAFLSQWLEGYTGMQKLTKLSKASTQYIDSLNKELERVFGEEVAQLYARIHIPEPEQLVLDRDQTDAEPGYVVLKYTGEKGPLVGKSIVAPRDALEKLQSKTTSCADEKAERESDKQSPTDRLLSKLWDGVHPLNPGALEVGKPLLRFLRAQNPCEQFVIVEPGRFEVAADAIPMEPRSASLAETWNCTSSVQDQTILSTVELEPSSCGTFVKHHYGADKCQKVVGVEAPAQVEFRPIHNSTRKAPMALVKINKIALSSSYIQLTENPLWIRNAALPLATFFSTDIVHDDAKKLFSALFQAKKNESFSDEYATITAAIAEQEERFQLEFSRQLELTMRGWKQAKNPAFLRLESLFRSREADAKIFTLHVKRLPALEEAEVEVEGKVELVIGTENFYSRPEHFYVSYRPAASRDSSPQLRQYLLFTFHPRKLQLTVEELGGSEVSELNVKLVENKSQFWKKGEDELIQEVSEAQQQLSSADRVRPLEVGPQPAARGLLGAPKPLYCAKDREMILRRVKENNRPTWKIANGTDPLVRYISGHPEQLMGGLQGAPEGMPLSTTAKQHVTIRALTCSREGGRPRKRPSKLCTPFVTIPPSIQVTRLNERKFFDDTLAEGGPTVSAISALVAEQTKLLMKDSESSRRSRAADPLRQFVEKETTLYERKNRWDEWARAVIGLFIPPVQSCFGLGANANDCLVDSFSIVQDVLLGLGVRAMTVPAKMTLKVVLKELASAATGGLTDLGGAISRRVVKRINHSLRGASRSPVSKKHIEELLGIFETVRGKDELKFLKDLSEVETIKAYREYVMEFFAKHPQSAKRFDSFIKKINALELPSAEPNELKRWIKAAVNEDLENVARRQTIVIPDGNAQALTGSQRRWIAENIDSALSTEEPLEIWARRARSQPEHVLDALEDELVRLLPYAPDCLIRSTGRQKRSPGKVAACHLGVTTKKLTYLRMRKMAKTDPILLAEQVTDPAKYNEIWLANFKLLGRDMVQNSHYNEFVGKQFTTQFKLLFSEAQYSRLVTLEDAAKAAKKAFREARAYALQDAHKRIEAAEKAVHQHIVECVMALTDEQQAHIFKRYWTHWFERAQEPVGVTLQNFNAHVYTGRDRLRGDPNTTLLSFPEHYVTALNNPTLDGQGNTQFLGLNQKNLRKLMSRNDGSSGFLFDHGIRHEMLHDASVYKSPQGDHKFIMGDHSRTIDVNRMTLYDAIEGQISGKSFDPELRGGPNGPVATGQVGMLAQDADIGAFIFGSLHLRNAPPGSSKQEAYKRILKLAEQVPTHNKFELANYMRAHDTPEFFRIL